MCAARQNPCAALPAAVCRARSIRWQMSRRWPMHCNFPAPPAPWSASISRTFPQRTSSPRWFVFETAFRTRIIIGDIECAQWKDRTTIILVRNAVKDNYRRYRVRTVEGQDDFASMAEVVRRRYSRILLEARETNPEAAEFSQENPAEAINHQPSTAFVRLPDLIIVDGGKGQLSAACRELQRLGLHDLPIIGLAKEHEEIFRPGRALPLQLPMDSGALRLLQRIRDEAHRFANAYHQLLMKKRIGESILDDCPGVSQNRKNLLLRKFGSVNRLRKATVDEIASTEGIGPKLAEEVHRFLERH